MKSTLIKGFLPWIAFLAFANGTPAGIIAGSLIGLISLLLFNRGSLKNKIWLDWIALLFFISMGIGAFIPISNIIYTALLPAYLIPTLVCFFSLLRSPSIALQYSKLVVDKTYWEQPSFIKVNQWLTLVWSLCFFISSLVVGLYFLHFGSLLWNIKILPTIFLLLAVGVTLLFPDLYKMKEIKRLNGLGSLKNLSFPKFITFNQVSMGYRTVGQGQGQSIILLSDFFMNAHAWSLKWVRSLSQHFQLILWDYPGMGYSNPLKTQLYTCESLSIFLKGFLAQLKNKPIALLGIGLGGWIAQTLVHRYSDRIKLILINTDWPDGSKKNFTLLKQWGQSILDSKEKLNLNLLFPEPIIPNISKEVSNLLEASRLEGGLSKEIFEKQCQLITDWYTHSIFKEKLTNEVLLITGLQDKLIPADSTHSLSQHFKKVIKMDFSDSGHGVIYQHPEEIANKICSFLSHNI